MVALFPACRLGNACSCRRSTAMLLLPLILAQALFVIAAPTQQAAASAPIILDVREQCGGLLWSGSLTVGSPMDAPYPQVKCGEGLRCHRDSKWYYECVPEVDTNAAWKLEEALHADNAAKVPVVEVTQTADAASEHMSDIFDETEQQHEGMLQHYLKEGAEVIKSMFHKDDSSAANKQDNTEGFHHEYNLAKTLASWAHRRQIKQNDSNNTDLLLTALNLKGKLDQYAQCGGIINAPQGQAKDGVWDGAQCWPGWSCNRVNQWYYQCQPVVDYSRPKTVVQVDGADKVILDVWAQCGGKGGQVPEGSQPVDGVYPEYICFANTNCTRQNEWYWQCLPLPGFNFGGPSGSPQPGGSPVPQPSPSPEPPLYPPPSPDVVIPPASYSPPLIYASPPIYPGYVEGPYYSSPPLGR